MGSFDLNHQIRKRMRVKKFFLYVKSIIPVENFVKLVPYHLNRFIGALFKPNLLFQLLTHLYQKKVLIILNIYDFNSGSESGFKHALEKTREKI